MKASTRSSFRELLHGGRSPVRHPTRRLTLAGLFIALGILIPFITAHAFGVPGTLLLPMHLPVLVAGLITGPLGGLATGVLTPLLSSLMTSMPPFYPMLPIMLVQLAVMGFLIGLLKDRARLGVIPSLILSSAAGWIAYGLVFRLLLLRNPNLRALSVGAALATGVPGLIIQLILVPLIYVALVQLLRHSSAERRVRAHADASESEANDGVRGGVHTGDDHRPAGEGHTTGDQRPDDETAAYTVGEQRPAGETDEPDTPVYRQAIGMIRSPGISCVVIRDGAIYRSLDGRGISPLLSLYRESPEVLHGATVVDRIIGKGAAVILVLGGAREVYGDLMSRAGRDYLEAHGIRHAAGRTVDLIQNRQRDGICPIERTVKDIDDPKEALDAIEAKLASLRDQSGTA